MDILISTTIMILQYLFLKKIKNNFKGATTVFKHHGLPVTDAALAESIYFNFSR